MIDKRDVTMTCKQTANSGFDGSKRLFVHWTKLTIAMAFVSLFLVLPGYSITLKTKALFNLDWKFYKGSLSGAEATGFNDASWEAVNVPHSVSYDAPTATLETKHYQGDAWYRKTFTCPAEAKKVFIHFEGAMQTSTVYVNGTQVGMHDNCGYTGFSFDISNAVLRGKSNVVAVLLNNKYDLNIPPAGSGVSGTPDFLLFSGLYRNVWLEFNDSLYVPFRGQRISTPGTATNGGIVHAITTVKNDSKSNQEVVVALTLRNSSGTSVATQSATKSITSGSSSIFDMKTSAVASAQLWSPSKPNLYSLQTLVSVNGVVIDSLLESVGFRYFNWSVTNAFSLNGSRLPIRGVCLHQFMGWIENAVPDSRFYKMVEMIKNMGGNSIRCAHYPRAEAFYKACDSLGMLVYVEIPSWGAMEGGAGRPFSARPALWPRIYSIDSAMVLDGYNHPSIYVWGMFNEPSESGIRKFFDNEIKIIHGLDSISESGRVAAVANNAGWTGVETFDFDIIGMNYEYTSKINKPVLNTEMYGCCPSTSPGGCNTGSWGRVFSRGNSSDLNVATGSEAANQVCSMRFPTTGACAGGHFWCFADYSCWHTMTGLQGIVDKMFLPKNVYFMFRKEWTSQATDYWQNGTPTKIDLTADLSNLKADGSDISLVTATTRDNNNQCMHKDGNITFTVTSGLATLFGGTTGSVYNVPSITVPLAGGRAGVLVRTTRTAGTITVVATSSTGLPADTVTLISTPATESFTNGSVSISKVSDQFEKNLTKLQMTTTIKGFTFVSSSVRVVQLLIVNSQGRTIFASSIPKQGSVFVNRQKLGNGIFYSVLQDGNQKVCSLLNTGLTR